MFNSNESLTISIVADPIEIGGHPIQLNMERASSIWV